MKNVIKKAIISIPAAAIAVFAAGTARAAALKDTLKNEAANTAGAAGLSTANANLGSTIGMIINAFLGLLGTIFVLLVIYAGFLWMTAQGEEEKVQKAKDILKNATIGLVLLFLAFAISNFVITAVTSAT